jgi:uncharacterized protein (DUF736 family)
MEDTAMSNKQASNKPAHRIRSGAIEVAIWRNDGDKGPWYSVTASRSYKQGEEWKQTDSYGQDDLLVLAKLLDMAHTWIMGQPQQSKQQAA